MIHRRIVVPEEDEKLNFAVLKYMDEKAKKHQIETDEGFYFPFNRCSKVNWRLTKEHEIEVVVIERETFVDDEIAPTLLERGSEYMLKVHDEILDKVMKKSLKKYKTAFNTRMRMGKEDIQREGKISSKNIAAMERIAWKVWIYYYQTDNSEALNMWVDLREQIIKNQENKRR